MKIESKFNDYYDNVVWTYAYYDEATKTFSAGDPKIRYERLEIENTGPFKFREIEPPFYHFHTSNYTKHTLIVGMRVYAVFKAIQWTGTEKPQYFLTNPNHEMFKRRRGLFRGDWRKEPNYRESDLAVELCRLVGQPVFWITSQHYPKAKWIDRSNHFIEVSKEIPVLCKIQGFAEAYPADQIYQDLSYVIGNLMHNPPDDNPPVQVEEKVRFLKKGFDAKTSFRGK